MRDVARDFVREHVIPHAADWDRTHTVPLEVLAKLGSFGFYGVTVPLEWHSMATRAQFLFSTTSHLQPSESPVLTVSDK